MTEFLDLNNDVLGLIVNLNPSCYYNLSLTCKRCSKLRNSGKKKEWLKEVSKTGWLKILVQDKENFEGSLIFDEENEKDSKERVTISLGKITKSLLVIIHEKVQINFSLLNGKKNGLMTIKNIFDEKLIEISYKNDEVIDRKIYKIPFLLFQ
jgi:hypothetical protein